jgi:hypothetical protein
MQTTERLDKQHDVALSFMLQFPELELMSLDEFLIEYETVLTIEQYRLGKAILNLWDNE